MNIALEKTEEYVNGQLRRSYGDAFVRGNNGMSFHTHHGVDFAELTEDSTLHFGAIIPKPVSIEKDHFYRGIASTANETSPRSDHEEETESLWVSTIILDYGAWLWIKYLLLHWQYNEHRVEGQILIVSNILGMMA
jgi:hypothetical protein